MTTVVLTHYAWRPLKRRIIQEYGTGIFLISWVLKDKLGFTVRTHLYQHGSDIRLDFNNAAAETFFRLKYL